MNIPAIYETMTCRFNGWWSLLLLPYTPFGLLLIALRLCMSLQVILMLILVPDGKLKRWIGTM